MYPLIIYTTFTVVVTSTTALYEAARFKPSQQSSTFLDFFAYLGNDGDFDANVYNKHCQHTEYQYAPWWIVDLLGQFVIEQIKLTNRGDEYSSAIRFKNFTFDIFDEDPRQLANFPNITGNICYYQIDPLGTGTYPFNCSTSIIGRYVRLIMINNENYPMNICELEVLVSSSRYEEIPLKREKNTKHLGTPLVQLTVRNVFLCARECLFHCMCNVEMQSGILNLCILVKLKVNL
nr:fucolectin-like; partial [Biomphalaria glabrata]